MTIDQLKADALEAISALFSDMSQLEEEQISALEEIRDLAAQNIDVLRDQIRTRCSDDE